MENIYTLKIGVLPSPNYLEIKRTPDNGFELSGFQGKFLGVILKTLGFKYEFVVPKIRMWGHRDNDGNWTGLIGLVNSSEADMAFSTIAVSQDRSTAVDFSNPVTAEGVTFLIEKSGNISPAFAYIYPFNIEIWICFICFLVSVPVLFQIVLGRKSYGHIILLLFASVLRQPLNMNNSSAKSKLLLIFWWQLAIILSFSYSAALLSFLTIPLQGETIKNFQQLASAVDKGTHRCYSILESDIVRFLLDSEQPHYTSLGKTIQRNNWFYSFANIKEGKYITRHSVELISRTSASLIYGNGEYRPNILISKDTLAVWPIAAALSKNFCCKSKVNKVISRMLSSGIPSKFLADETFKIHLADKRERIDPQATHVEKQLSLEDVSGTLMLLGGGYVISLLALVSEIIHASDASKFAYSTVAFLRVDTGSAVHIQLVQSKVRIAPCGKKETTIASRNVRVVAWILRFIHNISNVNKLRGNLVYEEFKKAENLVFKSMQLRSFQDEKFLAKMQAFKDEEGLLRIRTKLVDSDEKEDFKFPVLLPANDVVVKLIREEHKKAMHAGIRLRKTKDKLNAEYGDSALSLTTVKLWVAEFKRCLPA
ncbi:PBPe domain-containing protein [Nephila pilipes]|uniref:PBPe domain-containing protein n=3 Tax=Nephila pilipes TaxID=299642 RepID=A0A8X6UF39_NEPPI|nr:PBPe domain-containing protein [Nephila pilipes]